MSYLFRIPDSVFCRLLRPKIEPGTRDYICCSGEENKEIPNGPMPMNTTPQSEYQWRLEQRRTSAKELDSWHYRIGNTRLALFIAAVIMAWFAFQSRRISPWWLLAAGCAFIGLVAWHSRVLQRLERFNRSVDFYTRGLKRLDENWEGTGEPGDRFRDPSHPYSEDLDIFGKGSLFQLLCTARTISGEQVLASWLKSPAGADTIRARQEAVDELRSKLDLREDLAVLGADVRAGVSPDPLVHWGEGPERFHSNLIRITAAILTLLVLASIGVWIGTGREQWFLLGIFVELLFVFFHRHTVGDAVHAAERAGPDLELLSSVLARLEKESFKTPHLKSLRASLDYEGMPPSRIIARLNRLIVLLDSRKNLFFAPVAFILLWEIQLAFLVENWRSAHGHAIAGWLTTVAELEALSSLAGYGYEHPNDPFPEITAASPCFDGRGLGHPLIPESKSVRNDVTLTGDVQVLVVSGSNMSGKSTLLRTVGINAVLALAGAPVRAQSLRIAPLAVGASLRILDSLQGGTSRFYAEITRLRKLVTIAEGPIPLMFLLDELLHGTNSHDRRIGAEAVVWGLARRGALGLLTTHDLALAHIAEALAPHAVNVHFEDHIENGRIAFDYRLLPGIVRKSNALELMRSIGLEV